jgi:predicted ester cyclase
MTESHPSTSREDAIALVRRLLEAAQRRDRAAVAAIYAPDAVAISPVFGELHGAAAIAESWNTLFSSFTDLQFDISAVLVDGNRVAVLGGVVTTDRVGLFGRPPTGGPLTYRLVLLFTVIDGRIAHDQRIYDSAGIIERLDKARLDKELQVAADVQHALLQRIAQQGSFCESAGDSMPCRAIGGDFFEFIDPPSGGIVVVLGDVSGKGPAAALLAAMIQGMIAVEAPSPDGPAAIVSRINERLTTRDLDARFATLVYGVLSPDGRFVYTNAGHNPPLLLAGGTIHRLTAGGPIVGAFAGAAFREEMLQLRAGDTIVSFSDGVTEARNAQGEEFGEERLTAWLSRDPPASAAGLVDGLLAAVREFCVGSDQSDDITVAVIRFRG